MKSKYEPLQNYLSERRSSQGAVSLSFVEIEEIIGARLPKSTYSYREWWSDQSDVSNRPQAKAWINAGFEVDTVQQHRDRGSVRFRRR